MKYIVRNNQIEEVFSKKYSTIIRVVAKKYGVKTLNDICIRI